ncbi:MAG TPA: hypothetical protein ENN13_05575 [Candidatus Altiarchaeales archaeon]|nr:hypothetical protein [Candidatus Altiarchaeales archaeon]
MPQKQKRIEEVLPKPMNPELQARMQEKVQKQEVRVVREPPAQKDLKNELSDLRAQYNASRDRHEKFQLAIRIQELSEEAGGMSSGPQSSSFSSSTGVKKPGLFGGMIRGVPVVEGVANAIGVQTRPELRTTHTTETVVSNVDEGFVSEVQELAGQAAGKQDIRSKGAVNKSDAQISPAETAESAKVGPDISARILDAKKSADTVGESTASGDLQTASEGAGEIIDKLGGRVSAGNPTLSRAGENIEGKSVEADGFEQEFSTQTSIAAEGLKRGEVRDAEAALGEAAVIEQSAENYRQAVPEIEKIARTGLVNEEDVKNAAKEISESGNVSSEQIKESVKAVMDTSTVEKEGVGRVQILQADSVVKAAGKMSLEDGVSIHEVLTDSERRDKLRGNSIDEYLGSESRDKLIDGNLKDYLDGRQEKLYREMQESKSLENVGEIRRIDGWLDEIYAEHSREKFA